MILSFFLFMFFIVIAGIALGSLMTIKVWYSFPIVSLIIGIACFISLWVGVLIGAAYFSWLPIFFTRLLIIIYCLCLIIYFYKRFHPSYGYIPFRGFTHWGLLV